MSKVQLDYFNEAWNVMDVLVIVVSLFCCGITVYTDIVVKQLLKPLLAEPTLHGDFTTLAYWTDVQNNVFAVNVFFAWLKVFKYISFNRTMQQLSTTIARSEKISLVSLKTKFSQVRSRRCRLWVHVHDRFHGLCTVWVPPFRPQAL